MKIFKYQLHSDIIMMPKGAKILTVMMQGDVFCLWAEVDQKAKLEERFIEKFGTGQEIPIDMGIDRSYIGTVQDGSFVWHFYERVN